MNMDKLPRLLLSFNDSPSGKQYEDEEVNVAEYIGVKSYKAKGKRLSTHDVATYTFLEPFEPEEEELVEEENAENVEDTSEELENANTETNTSSNFNSTSCLAIVLNILSFIKLLSSYLK